MLNYLWGFLIILSIIVGVVTGTQQEVATGMLNGASSGVELVLKLTATMCLWNGIMKIAEKSGLNQKAAKLLAPVLRLIFPRVKDRDTLTAISMNVSANLIGLGNAATPLGLHAMRKLQEHNPDKTQPTKDMIRFVIMNTASITIIPTTIAMLRQKQGAAEPFDIVPMVIITSFAALTLALLAATAAEKFKR